MSLTMLTSSSWPICRLEIFCAIGINSQQNFSTRNTCLFLSVVKGRVVFISITRAYEASDTDTDKDG